MSPYLIKTNINDPGEWIDLDRVCTTNGAHEHDYPACTYSFPRAKFTVRISYVDAPLAFGVYDIRGDLKVTSAPVNLYSSDYNWLKAPPESIQYLRDVHARLFRAWSGRGLRSIEKNH